MSRVRALARAFAALSSVCVLCGCSDRIPILFPPVGGGGGGQREMVVVDGHLDPNSSSAITPGAAVDGIGLSV